MVAVSFYFCFIKQQKEVMIMKNKSLLFSILASPLIIAFLFLVNYLTSWSHPWFIYPTFLVLWWPMSLYFVSTKNWRGFAVIGSLFISAFFVTINMITSPGYPWAVFPIFACAWWPMSVILLSAKKYKIYAIIASAMIIMFFFIVNMVSSPHVTWFIYPAFAVLWWPLTSVFALLNNRKK